jgi:hypothetical protein
MQCAVVPIQAGTGSESGATIPNVRRRALLVDFNTDEHHNATTNRGVSVGTRVMR